MNIISPMADAPFYTEFNAPGVSWAAVIGGAFVTAAFALVLIILGVGFGLSWISPWAGAGASSKTISASAIVWLIATQAIASGLGGYLVGRLRVKWPTVHTHEVYFRDTAHGLLVWAVAVVITAAFLGSAVSVIVGSRTKVAAPTAAVGSFVGTEIQPMPDWQGSNSATSSPKGYARGHYRRRTAHTRRRGSRRGPDSRKPMRRSESMRFTLKARASPPTRS